MLKPYNQRVYATYALMQSFIEFTATNSSVINKIRNKAKEQVKTQNRFPVTWSLDKSQYREVLYKGYSSSQKTSDVSGLPRLYYDRSKPFEKNIPIYDYYTAKEFISKPLAYIIPQGWWKVTDLLQLNQVKMQRLKKDTTIEVEVYKIEDYKSSVRQYEMHHPNSEIKISTMRRKIMFRKGDWYIPMNQAANRFLAETLEPQMEDSYFTWNFFDSILGQKEGYSAYAFEDIAAAYLKTNPDLKIKLESQRLSDTAFAKSSRAQLNFVFEHSPWFETAYNQYPVYRVTE
jgi:hypothetical protein